MSDDRQLVWNNFGVVSKHEVFYSRQNNFLDCLLISVWGSYGTESRLWRK